MIIGLGVDLVEVNRVERLFDRYGNRFAQRILAPSEYEEFARTGQPARFLAKRFSVKEACVKALGTGFSAGVRFRDIAVGHDAAGAPRLELHGPARERLWTIGGSATLVSLSDERRNVVAVVLVQATPPA